MNERQRFAILETSCWICGDIATDTHEIARGVHRKAALTKRSCWLRLCHQCHIEQVHGTGFWSRLAVQYALKMIRDGVHYNRVEINGVRGRAPDAIDEAEVASVIGDVVNELLKRRSL